MTESWLHLPFSQPPDNATQHIISPAYIDATNAARKSLNSWLLAWLFDVCVLKHCPNYTLEASNPRFRTSIAASIAAKQQRCRQRTGPSDCPSSSNPTRPKPSGRTPGPTPRPMKITGRRAAERSFCAPKRARTVNNCQPKKRGTVWINIALQSLCASASIQVA